MLSVALIFVSAGSDLMAFSAALMSVSPSMSVCIRSLFACIFAYSSSVRNVRWSSVRGLYAFSAAVTFFLSVRLSFVITSSAAGSFASSVCTFCTAFSFFLSVFSQAVSCLYSVFRRALPFLSSLS